MPLEDDESDPFLEALKAPHPSWFVSEEELARMRDELRATATPAQLAELEAQEAEQAATARLAERQARLARYRR